LKIEFRIEMWALRKDSAFKSYATLVIFLSGDLDDAVDLIEDPMTNELEREPRILGEDLVDRPVGEEACLADTSSCRMRFLDDTARSLLVACRKLLSCDKSKRVKSWRY